MRRGIVLAVPVLAVAIGGGSLAALGLGRLSSAEAPSTAAPDDPVARAGPIARGIIEPDGVRRGRQLRVSDGGVVWAVQASGGTVGELLREAGVRLGPLDRLEPDAAAPLESAELVRVIRVSEFVERQELRVPPPVEYRDDPEIERGTFRLLSAGVDGWVERVFNVRTVDGTEVARELLAELVVDSAVPDVVGRGTRLPTVASPYGPLSYLRALPVLATYYTPANGGKSPDDPWYGRTATGARATRGVVAVDRRVIPLYTWLYVPGYGIAQALDVGSAIIGNHIDVCFDDGDGAWWGTRYVTVYVLPGPVRSR